MTIPKEFFEKIEKLKKSSQKKQSVFRPHIYCGFWPTKKNRNTYGATKPLCMGPIDLFPIMSFKSEIYVRMMTILRNLIGKNLVIRIEMIKS